MKRVSELAVAMHNAFRRPLINEDSFKEAIRVHFFAGFAGYDMAETYDINWLEMQFVFAYVQTYAAYKNNSNLTENEIAECFAEHFITSSTEEVWDQEDDKFIVDDGVFYASIPGVQGLDSDGVYNVVLAMAASVASELKKNGTLPMYMDIALGYRHGETVTVMGNNSLDAIVVMDDSLSFLSEASIRSKDVTELKF